MKRSLALMIALVIAAVPFLSACDVFENNGEVKPNDSSSLNGVVINEVVSSNTLCWVDPVYGSVDWAELHNTSSSPVDISGFRFADNVSFARALTFPEGTVIPAKGFLCVLCIADPNGLPETEGVFIAPFGIARAGERLYLSADASSIITLEVPYLNTDVSYARKDNGSYGYSSTPTFAQANTNISDTPDGAEVVIIPKDQIRLSELVTGSSGWVELHNISDEPALLSDYSLSDNEENTEKWHCPEITVPAGGYIVVELNQLDPENPLNASFKVSHEESCIYLFNSIGEKADEMTVDPLMPDGVSAVRTADGVAYTSHITKGEDNYMFTFPEIKWSEMDVSAPSTRLYINEVVPSNKYGIVDSYGDRSDWAELYNPSDLPAYLNEYYLSDDPNDPLKWQLPQVALLPGEYVLIFLSGNETVGSEIHAPFRLSDKDGGIYLSTLDGMQTDMLPIPEGLLPNASVGRNENREIRYYPAPTPGEPNDTYGFDDASLMMAFDPNGVYISEILAVSAPKSGEDDWIEIVNCSAHDLSLAGWSLTDDPDEPRKFMLDNYSISAGGYAVVYCDGSSQSSSRAPFSLSNAGETICLVDAEGRFVDVFRTGMTTLGTTSGRANRTQTGERCFFASATKGYANGTPLRGIVSEPVFSVTGLYFEGASQVAISCRTDGAVIRYTLDGSNPTPSSALYSEPITVSNNTVVKARAFMDGLIQSPVAAHTYLVGESFTMPVVSISLSSADFSRMYTASMSPNGGITHGPQVACNMEYYVDGRLVVSTGAGVRVSGASTSLHAQKSLGLYFRAGYGRSSLDIPLFEDCSVTSFRSIVLRNAGQDAQYARLRDSLMSVICQGMEIDVSYFKPVIVFVNGNYYGIYDMKENMNEDYVAAHHGVDRSSVNIIKRNGMRLAGDNADFLNLRSFCRSYSFANQDNYERLKERVDVLSIMDYLIARTYFYDQDMFNQKYWRTTDGTMKWRAVFYDSDYALFGNSSVTSILGAYFSPNGVAAAHGSITNMDIYYACNQSQEWRDEFITRYIYYVKYVFNAEKATAALDSLVEIYRPEMRRHIAKWHMPSSMSSWENEISALRRCLEKRPENALRNLRNYYGLSEARFAEYEAAADAMFGN